MSNEGVEWNLAGIAKDTLEKRTGYKDAGIIQRPESYLTMQQLIRILKENKEKVETQIKKIDKAVSRAMEKRGDCMKELKEINRGLASLAQLDKDFVFRDSVAFSQKAIHQDISKLALITGNVKDEKSDHVSEVMG